MNMSEIKRTISIVLQAFTVAALLALVVFELRARAEREAEASALRALMLEPRYEYKVVTFAGSDESRTGEAAMKPTSIEVDDKELSRLGSQGWGVVNSFFEMETAYPNFGNDKYVTGLQTNIRPQRLVILLRHRIG